MTNALKPVGRRLHHPAPGLDGAQPTRRDLLRLQDRARVARAVRRVEDQPRPPCVDAVAGAPAEEHLPRDHHAEPRRRRAARCTAGRCRRWRRAAPGRPARRAPRAARAAARTRRTAPGAPCRSGSTISPSGVTTTWALVKRPAVRRRPRSRRRRTAHRVGAPRRRPRRARRCRRSRRRRSRSPARRRGRARRRARSCAVAARWRSVTVGWARRGRWCPARRRPARRRSRCARRCRGRSGRRTAMAVTASGATAATRAVRPRRPRRSAPRLDERAEGDAELEHHPRDQDHAADAGDVRATDRPAWAMPRLASGTPPNGKREPQRLDERVGGGRMTADHRAARSSSARRVPGRSARRRRATPRTRRSRRCSPARTSCHIQAVPMASQARANEEAEAEARRRDGVYPWRVTPHWNRAMPTNDERPPAPTEAATSATMRPAATATSARRVKRRWWSRAPASWWCAAGRAAPAPAHRDREEVEVGDDALRTEPGGWQANSVASWRYPG